LSAAAAREPAATPWQGAGARCGRHRVLVGGGRQSQRCDPQPGTRRPLSMPATVDVAVHKARHTKGRGRTHQGDAGRHAATQRARGKGRRAPAGGESTRQPLDLPPAGPSLLRSRVQQARVQHDDWNRGARQHAASSTRCSLRTRLAVGANARQTPRARARQHPHTTNTPIGNTHSSASHPRLGVAQALLVEAAAHLRLEGAHLVQDVHHLGGRRGVCLHSCTQG
jgi:hypothetical protein